ncbi:MAG: type II toxin-antitoxin system VapC family toxin [Prevotellaceae bacterium]|nr:type II toxin-antitoxin system VapC family toxin [Prevotellaceae bacterium]
MEVVVDANIFLAVLLNEPDNERIIEATRGVSFIAPEILPYEIGNALSSSLKRKHIDENEVLFAYQLFTQIPVRRTYVDIPAALELVNRFKIYAYDACYLEVAQRLNLPLFTLDTQMKEKAELLKLKIWNV